MLSTLTRRRFAAGALSLAGARPALAAPDLSKVTLRVADQVGTYQSKLRTAGLLDNLPYRIEWSIYPAAVQLHEALKADAADIGGANDSPTVSAMAGGSPISVVASWGNGGGGTYLLVPKDSPARSVGDLKGKIISPTTRGSVAHYLVVGELQKAGLRLDEVKLAFLNPADALAAFSSGSIDAWATWSIYAARLRGTFGARVISDGKGINSGLFVLSATPSAISDPGKLAAIADFSDRMERSFVWSRAHRAEHIAWYKAFAKQDEAIAEAVYDDDAQYRRLPIDTALAARLEKTFTTWKSAGLLSGDIDFNARLYRNLPVA